MTHTEIVKEKLKEIERIDKLKEDMTSKCWLSSQLRINRFKIEGELSGMQAAIKSELEFLESFAENLILGKRKRGQHKYNKIDIRERITNCKNALKLIEGGK